MKSLACLLLFASAVFAYELSGNFQAIELIAEDTFSVFNKYAGSRKEIDLKPLENNRSPNGSVSFCSTSANCWEKNSRMVEGPMKVFSCGNWENHAIPSFIRGNNITEISKVRFIGIDTYTLMSRWTFIQEGFNRMECRVLFYFDHVGNPALSKVELTCPFCSFNTNPAPVDVAKTVESMTKLIEGDLQNYIQFRDMKEPEKALDYLKHFVESYRVSNIYTDLYRDIDTSTRCTNVTNGGQEHNRNMSNGYGTPIEEIHIAQFLRSQKLVRIQSDWNYIVNKIDNNLYKVQSQWTLYQRDRVLSLCTPSFLFDTALPDAIALSKFSLDCHHCV